MVDWIKIPYATKSILLLIEAAVRVEFECKLGYTLMGNDHFQYDISNRLEDIEHIRQIAIATAIKACEQYGIEYEYKRAD